MGVAASQAVNGFLAKAGGKDKLTALIQARPAPRSCAGPPMRRSGRAWPGARCGAGLTPRCGRSMRPCSCRLASRATRRRCRCRSPRRARFSASSGCGRRAVPAPLPGRAGPRCRAVTRSPACDRGRRHGGSAGAASRAPPRRAALAVHVLGRLQPAPPDAQRPGAAQPLEQLTPLVLNPRLNPSKPPALELINKARAARARLSRTPAPRAPRRQRAERGPARAAAQAGADGRVLWRGPRRLGQPGRHLHQQAGGGAVRARGALPGAGGDAVHAMGWGASGRTCVPACSACARVSWVSGTQRVCGARARRTSGRPASRGRGGAPVCLCGDPGDLGPACLRPLHAAGGGGRRGWHAVVALRWKAARCAARAQPAGAPRGAAGCAAAPLVRAPAAAAGGRAAGLGGRVRSRRAWAGRRGGRVARRGFAPGQGYQTLTG